MLNVIHQIIDVDRLDLVILSSSSSSASNPPVAVNPSLALDQFESIQKSYRDLAESFDHNTPVKGNTTSVIIMFAYAAYSCGGLITAVSDPGRHQTVAS